MKNKKNKKNGVSIRKVFFTSFYRWTLMKTSSKAIKHWTVSSGLIFTMNTKLIPFLPSVFIAYSMVHKQSFPFGTLSTTPTPTVVYIGSNNKVMPIISTSNLPKRTPVRMFYVKSLSPHKLESMSFEFEEM